MFLIGVCIGGIIAYGIFVYMHGKMYENLLEQNIELRAEVSELTNRNETLIKDQKNLDEKSHELSTIEHIEITIHNEKEMEFDRLESLDLAERMKKEVHHIIGKEISEISEHDQLLISSIENKPFQVGDYFYYFRVYQLTIANTVKIKVQARLSKDD